MREPPAAGKNRESPIFVKTHDYLCWLLAHTIQFPKSQRFVMARRIEETALDFQERLIRAARRKGNERRRQLAEADILFEILRRHIRTSVELKLLTVKQYEYSSRKIVEIGRLLGGWMKNETESAGQTPAVGVGP